MPSRETLIQPVRALCAGFSTNAPIPDILRQFTTSPPPLAAEYGLKSLAPFLGRDFKGQHGVADYFRLVTEILAVETMSFESESSWMIDENIRAVGLRGKGRFIWKDTGQICDEEFFYRMEIAQEEDDNAGKGQWKVQDYRVWSDTGAAYLARLGKLAECGTEGGNDPTAAL
ncbi:uncharacterized protein N7498_006894 [Penicillium cinerascens]|uniref:SnoaL-like domain-containing protein n=1 Tax=Penicillium cinerascens TaxID=70096 RepID=A0A9W9JJY6_9EURO|nr:uncharacterized protein N7498_006894 [Penicillium cinerascens]KAJ5197777.1 hypothetical protein N7498_006894 [Penicillium cinerascens]